MRKLLKVNVKDKKTGEEKEYKHVYDFGHYWDSNAQYFRVLTSKPDHTQRILLEPRHDFIITIEEEEEIIIE
jgi:hypothetical protein